MQFFDPKPFSDLESSMLMTKWMRRVGAIACTASMFATTTVTFAETPLVNAAETKGVTLLSENPTVPKVMRIVDERRRGTEEVRKSLRNDNGTEKTDEYKRGTQKKNRKERAAGNELIELHLY